MEASPSSPTTTCVDSKKQSEESQTTQALRERMVLLEMKVNDLEEKLAPAKSENAALLDRQFSIEKIKDDNVAILFYTGFPNYQALVSFYTYIEPKLHKMQYWRGDKQVKESQPYQDDKHRKKPRPSRKLSYFEEMVLVLMRLKAGLFIQDLADRFGISKTLVSKIIMHHMDKFALYGTSRHLPVSISRACTKEHAKGICGIFNNKNNFGLHGNIYRAPICYAGTI